VMIKEKIDGTLLYANWMFNFELDERYSFETLSLVDFDWNRL